MDRKIFGIGGEAPAALARVPDMKIGDSVIENREVLVADLFKDGQSLEGQGDHDALFGADFFAFFGQVQGRGVILFKSPADKANRAFGLTLGDQIINELEDLLEALLGGGVVGDLHDFLVDPHGVDPQDRLGAAAGG
mgnify:CR=1 FL=1